MSNGTNIKLTEKEERFIAAQVGSGEFVDASEVVRAGLQMLEQRQQELEFLRRSIDEGDAAYERGEVETFTQPNQLATDLKDQLRKRHAAK